MRKVFKLDEIDCAVCAGKLEDAIKKLDGVQDAKINFLTQKLQRRTCFAIKKSS